MIIRCQQVSKRYNQHWVIKKLDYNFTSGIIYGIKGANGSGKSTLLKMLSGFLSPTLGTITYVNDQRDIARDDIFRYVSIWGPHTSMPSTLTVLEFIRYYGQMKGWVTQIQDQAVFDLTQLPVPENRRIDQLSSGQAQRLGLTLTLLSSSSIVLLDEPGSYLDVSSKSWMQEMIQAYRAERLLIIASNDDQDLQAAKEMITL